MWCMWWPAVVKSDYGRSPHAYVNQRLQKQLELLMMSGVPLETCWAFNERWNNKFCYKVASCWLFLPNLSRCCVCTVHLCSFFVFTVRVHNGRLNGRLLDPWSCRKCNFIIFCEGNLEDSFVLVSPLFRAVRTKKGRRTAAVSMQLQDIRISYFCFI